VNSRDREIRWNGGKTFDSGFSNREYPTFTIGFFEKKNARTKRFYETILHGPDVVRSTVPGDGKSDSVAIVVRFPITGGTNNV